MGLIKLVEGNVEFLTEKINIQSEEAGQKFSDDLNDKLNNLAADVAKGKFKQSSDLLEKINETFSIEELIMFTTVQIIEKVEENPLSGLLQMLQESEED